MDGTQLKIPKEHLYIVKVEAPKSEKVKRTIICII